jgi:hypothetical protein
MSMPSSALRIGLVALLVISALAFPLAIAAERAAVAGEQRVEAPTASGGEADESRSENGEAGHPEAHGENAPGAGVTGESRGESAAIHAEAGGEETLFGIDPEADMTVVAAVILSLLLAIAIWARPSAALLGAVVVFALLFSALDVREVQHQAAESRGGLLAAALFITLLHLVIVVVAIAALWKRPAGVHGIAA